MNERRTREEEKRKKARTNPEILANFHNALYKPPPLPPYPVFPESLCYLPCRQIMPPPNTNRVFKAQYQYNLPVPDSQVGAGLCWYSRLVGTGRDSHSPRGAMRPDDQRMDRRFPFLHKKPCSGAAGMIGLFLLSFFLSFQARW